MSVSLRLAALVWAAAALSVTPSAEAQFSPPPWPPPPPPSPPPPSPPPPSPASPPPPPATGFTPTVRILGNATGNEAAVTVSNCCQWYKWCDNTAVQYQCDAALLTDCGAIAPGSWNASCSACMMCQDSEATPGAMRAKSYLAIDHPYQACIDTRRTVQTQHQIADPDHAQSVGKERQIARDYLPSGQPEFVVCKALNYKCLKQRSAAKAGNPCEVIPGVKIPGMRHTSQFQRLYDGSNKDPRRGPQEGRLHLGAGTMVYDAARNADAVADMHDRGNATHTGFKYPHGITKFDGNGTSPAYNASAIGVAQYSPTSDPVGR